MCQSMCNGIPIEEPTFRKYSIELQNAWNLLDSWVKDKQKNDLALIKNEMPIDVVEAYKLIIETPIPGFGNYTGKDSCYINNLEVDFTD